MRAKREIVGALDLGSSSVALVIAEVSREDVTVLGTGIAPCEGLSNGRVISINDTAAAITAARVEAEHMSGCELSEVYVSFSGRDITGMNNRGLIYHRKCAQVSRGDLESAIENAIHVRLDEGVVLNVVPRQYILDRHEGIKDPVGMSGVQLEAEVHMTIADRAALDTIERCVLKASLKVRDFVVAPLASSLAVLREDERKMGVIMLDLGTGTSNIQIWQHGRLEWTGVIDMGTDLITTAISRSLRTPVSCAEDIRLRFGAACLADDDVNQPIPVACVGGRGPAQISRRMLVENIIQPTVVDWLTTIASRLQTVIDFNDMTAGIVLTGAAALLPGIELVSNGVFNLNTRLGAPESVGGINSRVEQNPMMSAAWGTVIYRSMLPSGDAVQPMTPRSAREMPGGGFGGLISRAINFLF
ncbi:MAG TPA: cell division protein FtsA [Myxococcota bacterium]|nr:cell division protein FtsA [Myxococcota bacterium]